MSNKKYIPVNNDYDKFDLDNSHIIIRKSNLNKYFEKYNCDSKEELEDMLWLNYGVSCKIV